MTPKQLAQHWHISEAEAQEISDFINRFYQLDVVPVSGKNQTLWQGVMYAYDPDHKYTLMESDKKFTNRERAILNWTNQMQHYKIPVGQARQMRCGQGVPTDVYLALNPVAGYEQIAQKISLISALSGKARQGR
ncbi:MAG: hypothetical protein ACI4OR_04205 [Alphaproteobacteria bacterium]